MKILFTTRSSLFSQPGGDTQQVNHTAEVLRALGHTVDVVLRGESVKKLNSYDLVHFFNLGRPADVVDLLPQLSQPLVVSSIWVDYSEFDHQRSGTIGKIKNIFGYDAVEYAKSLARGINGSDKLPGWQYLKHGHYESMRLVANRANLIITSSTSEKQRIEKNLTDRAQIKVISLGLADAFRKAPPQKQSRAGVISVGRIEGLKNQLNLIHAAHSANWPLRIVGKPTVNQKEYYQKCLTAATPNVTFSGWLDGEHLLEAYRQAKVMVLPSYFETFGLVALEALSQGCNLVIADRPDMNTIFKGRAFTANPNSPQDLREKIERALQLPPTQFTKEERQRHDWKHIGQQIEHEYKTLLQNTPT